MIKIIISDISGFCFGVEKAVNSCKKYYGSNFHTYGPLIHNPDILHEISQNGGEILSNTDNVEKSKIIIRAHGVSDKEICKIKSRDNNIIDATCPFVKRLQTAAKNFDAKGFQIIIVGQAEHPEIRAITEDLPKTKVIFSVNDALNVPSFHKICLLSQTTERNDKVEAIKNILEKKCKILKQINTICADVTKRQKAAKQVAKKADIVLVIGGRKSSNTKKLLDICQEHCPAYLLENEKDLNNLLEIKPLLLRNIKILGICSGASTPESTIQQIIKNIIKTQNISQR